MLYNNIEGCDGKGGGRSGQVVSSSASHGGGTYRSRMYGGRKGEMIKNPLAMRKTMNEMIDREMREVQETSRRNEEIISQLRSDMEALDVCAWIE